MMLRPAVFSLKVFTAEDIPQSKSFSCFFWKKKRNILTKADGKIFPAFYVWQMGQLFTCNKFKPEVRARSSFGQ